MGCSGSKEKDVKVVEVAPSSESQTNTDTKKESTNTIDTKNNTGNNTNNNSSNGNTKEQQTPNSTKNTSNTTPNNSNNTQSNNNPNSKPPSPLTDRSESDSSEGRSSGVVSDDSSNISRGKKGEIVEIDFFSNKEPAFDQAKSSAVRERLEAYSEKKKKQISELAPNNSTLEKRLQQAEERRIEHESKRISKARAINEHVKGRAETLREAEERKTQELMDLIKQKSRNASASRQARRTEIVQNASEEVSKAKELSKLKKENPEQDDTTEEPEVLNPTPTSTSTTSILSSPLPPLPGSFR